MLAARLSHWKTLAIHTSSHNHLTSSSSSGGDLSGGENYGDDDGDGDGKDDCDEQHKQIFPLYSTFCVKFSRGLL